MNKIFTLIVLCSCSLAYAQKYPGGKGSGLYGTGDNEVDKGWFFGIGATYMFPYLKETYEQAFTDTSGNNIELDYMAKPTGKFGLYAEIGKFRMNGRRVINYMDYALAYKWLRGGENYELASTYNGIALPTLTQEGSFSDHLLSANFRVGNRIDKNEKTFFINGLG